MSEVKSNVKETSKKLKELKIDEKKLLNATTKKPVSKQNIILPSSISKMKSKESKNSANEKQKTGEIEKANLTAREKIEVNKQTSSENKSFSENDISEYDDEWRNLNELVFKSYLNLLYFFIFSFIFY